METEFDVQWRTYMESAVEGAELLKQQRVEGVEARVRQTDEHDHVHYLRLLPMICSTIHWKITVHFYWFVRDSVRVEGFGFDKSKNEQLKNVQPIQL